MMKSATAARLLAGLLLIFVDSSLAGRLEPATFRSAILGREVRYLVALPANYEARRAAGERFRVLYLLHCAGCDEATWAQTGSGSYAPDLQRLIDSTGLIAAAPFCGLGWWLDSPIDSLSQWSAFLSREFKPRIDSLLPTCPGREAAGLGGHSMGGYGALYNALRHSSLFSAAYGIKSLITPSQHQGEFGLAGVLGYNPTVAKAFDLPALAPGFAGRGLRLRFYSGNTDWFLAENQELHRKLNLAGVTHEYFEVDGEGHPVMTPAQMLPMLRWFDTVLTCPEASQGILLPAAPGHGLAAGFSLYHLDGSLARGPAASASRRGSARLAPGIYLAAERGGRPPRKVLVLP